MTRHCLVLLRYPRSCHGIGSPPSSVDLVIDQRAVIYEEYFPKVDFLLIDSHTFAVGELFYLLWGEYRIRVT
jgi:hypothetical protein